MFVTSTVFCSVFHIFESGFQIQFEILSVANLNQYLIILAGVCLIQCKAHNCLSTILRLKFV